MVTSFEKAVRARICKFLVIALTARNEKVMTDSAPVAREIHPLQRPRRSLSFLKVELVQRAKWLSQILLISL